MTVISFICLLIATVAVLDQFTDVFRTNKEKFDKKNFEQGDLKPARIDESKISAFKYEVLSSPVIFKSNILTNDSLFYKGLLLKNFGNYEDQYFTIGDLILVCKSKDLLKGIRVFNPFNDSCVHLNLQFVVKDKRLYVSAEFKDINTLLPGGCPHPTFPS